MTSEELEVVGSIDLNEEEDEMHYDKLVLSDDSDADDDETLEILLRNEKSHTSGTTNAKSETTIDDSSNDLIENADSFVRAFLTQMRLHETLNTFQAEWYRLEATGSLDRSKIGKVPLRYLEYFYSDQKLRKLESEVKRMQSTATRVQKTWSKLKVERDSYKLAHMRVGQEKHITLEAIRGVLNQTNKKMPALDDLNAKIESADKDRMLLELEVQRLRQMHERLLAAQPKQEPESPKTSKKKQEEETKVPPPNIQTVLPANEGLNPYKEQGKPNLEQLTHRVVTKAHNVPVSCVAVHPKRKVYATTGDDAVWHLWNADNNELLISGRGHTKWISSCAFHPRGAHLATTSADGTVRVWDFLSSKCALVLNGHIDTVWCCDFNSGGRVLASGGADGTVRLWDMQGGQQLSILHQGDKDVNCLKWMPFSNVFVTGGADHVVGLWDARQGAMINRGLGHGGTVFGVAPALNGNTIASVDGHGGIKVWDIRKMNPVFETQYTSGINACGFDASGSFIFAACDDGKAQVFLTDDAKSTWAMSSFDAPCETIAVNADSDLVVCGCMDGSVAVCTMT